MIYRNLTLKLGFEILLWASLAAFISVACFVLLKWRHIRYQLQAEVVLLELTPPPTPQKTLLATEEFFTVLSRVLGLRTWRELANGRKASIALEVVSTAHEGIRYLIRLPLTYEATFLHNLAAFAPTVSVERVLDYLPEPDLQQTKKLIELRQTGRRDYALKHSHQETPNDPIAYITNAMSSLDDNELIALQLVIAPGDYPVRITQTTDSSTQTVPEDLVYATIHKQSQPQFQCSMRVLIQVIDEERATQRLQGIKSAYAAYSYDGFQSLHPRLDISGRLQDFRHFSFQHRLPALLSRNACLFSSSELAALYHFPYGTAAQTEDLLMANQTALPIPLSVKNQSSSTELLLGENVYRGRITPIGLKESERRRHVYVVGGTGNGKSTLLQYAIVQDMRAGKGVAVIDPHGDLAESLLKHVPTDRIDDVIYFNPSDIRYPIGLNLLELTPGLDDDALLLEKDMVTESIISIFRKIFSTNATNGHRIEYVLRNAVQTALTLEKPTLFTVYDLLNDSAFRKRAVKDLDSPELLLFWREFNRGGSFQQVSMAAGITAKIGRFLFSASARRILEQPASSINFDKLMQQGKILICNVSKGQLGEDTSELFGIMLLTKIQLATWRRAKHVQRKRRPFYVYIDEFQNFATPSFAQLLSEGRKYGLFLTMAEQSTSQQSDRSLIDIVFANVGTMIAFRTSSQQDEQLIQPLLSPQVAPGTLGRLPAYNFYIRISAEISQPPFTGRTVVLPDPGENMIDRLVIQASRRHYGRKPKAPHKVTKRRSPDTKIYQTIANGHV